MTRLVHRPRPRRPRRTRSRRDPPRRPRQPVKRTPTARSRILPPPFGVPGSRRDSRRRCHTGLFHHSYRSVRKGITNQPGTDTGNHPRIRPGRVPATIEDHKVGTKATRGSVLAVQPADGAAQESIATLVQDPSAETGARLAGDEFGEPAPGMASPLARIDIHQAWPHAAQAVRRSHRSETTHAAGVTFGGLVSSPWQLVAAPAMNWSKTADNGRRAR